MQILAISSWARKTMIANARASTTWKSHKIGRDTILTLLKYAFLITTPSFRGTAILGFMLLIIITLQIISGFLLLLVFLPEPTFIMLFRCESTNEIWWFTVVHIIHVLGVDALFVCSYIHLFKKLYLRNYAEGDTDGWFSGIFSFLFLHIIVFFGITLNSSHLGDITVTIAANIYWSLFGRIHKIYAPLFSNKHLNVDLAIRFANFHYCLGFYFIFISQLHVLYIHESWDSESEISVSLDSFAPKFSWIWDALQKEAMWAFSWYIIFISFCLIFSHPDFRTVNYTFFEHWSEAEVEEINFFVVAPHWYFRAHMGLLTVCSHHYEGIFWLVFFYILLLSMPMLSRLYNPDIFGLGLTDSMPIRHARFQHLLFLFFVMSIIYVSATLPCGRFYYESTEGFCGNILTKLSYQYIYIYLGFLTHIADRIERAICGFPVYGIPTLNKFF